MPIESIDIMTKTAKQSAKTHLDEFQSDMRESENFVLIRGAKVRNSMSQTFISDLENDRHTPNFLDFLDK